MSRIFSFGSETQEPTQAMAKSMPSSGLATQESTDPFSIIENLMQDIEVLKSTKNQVEAKADEFTKSLSDWLE